ncbi:MAG: AAA family ATPase [Immundisolibacter sp.]|uniref:AAA family ATPase n=1 Tax=Immundisolibacter sp. TaxID=1934948 RepID=UPI003EE2C7C5
MRIRSIKINRWRHFEHIELQLDSDTGLVCIVGANGTGKSHLLELIAACAHRLGLSQGIEIPRGDPFSDQHDFSLKFFLAEGVSDAIDKGLASEAAFAEWDRTLTIESRNIPDNSLDRIEAGGIADANQRGPFANQVINQLRQSKSVHFLSLDADRAYPKKNINVNEVAQAYEIDWEGLEYTRGRSFKTTTMLYDEWMKYFLAQENQSGTRLIKEIRKARQAGGTEPTFTDHFNGYKEALQKVIPHVVFTGVDSKKRTLLFDTTGLELSFDQLSGGEREIAFLIGQIDRFGLRQGLFLLDEPELHLNADLIRTWVAYLTSTVRTGQIWLATHSLEAVEAAGQQATFVLERNEGTRKVDSLDRLDTRPVLSALSRAVGTPAFSISKLLFVFVEGEEGVGERERFHKLAGLPQDVRFMECGSCNEVLRRVAAIKALANETEAGIRIGGVVDRDFRSDASASAITNNNGVFVLPVHEAENFFLHPVTLAVLLLQHGRAELLPSNLIREAADARAGNWIFQHTMATPNAKSLPDISVMAKEHAKALTWAQLGADRNAAIQRIVDTSGYDADNQQKLQGILEISTNLYARKRAEDGLWKVCEGKQVLNDVARTVGFAGAPALVQATFAAWARDGAQIPEELTAFREYLAKL